MAGWGIATAPFDWDIPLLPRDPVPVDAIPDIGDNQQIVFTGWEGQSPQDIEDQITYPLTTELLGISGVRTIRSNSMFGFSSINIIFEDDVKFYWSRARILEKLNALPSGLLPEGVQPALGPDATALGQIFWYTLEGKDPDGNATGGWDPHELRTIQDFQVQYALSSVKGVAEVASIGGHVREYQVDIDPDAMVEAGVSILKVADAVRKSNREIGARTIEMNRDHEEMVMEEPDPTDLRHEVDADFRNEFTHMVHAYITVKDALVESDFETAMDTGENFMESLQSIGQHRMTGDAHMAWMDYYGSIESHGTAMLDAGDLDQFRGELRFLSDILINAVMSLGAEDDFYHQYCPMAFGNKGGHWISNVPDIRNPYLPDTMPGCGEVRSRMK